MLLTILRININYLPKQSKLSVMGMETENVYICEVGIEFLSTVLMSSIYSIGRPFLMQKTT
jgi:hypothetical protein